MHQQCCKDIPDSFLTDHSHVITQDITNITQVSHNLAEIKFTYLPPSLRVQAQTVGELARDGMDSHPLGCTVNHTELPTMQCSSGVIRHLQPALAALINITTTGKILPGLRIQMDPGCEVCRAFHWLLQS